MGHRDQETERKEHALEQLSSFCSTPDGQSQPEASVRPQDNQGAQIEVSVSRNEREAGQQREASSMSEAHQVVEEPQRSSQGNSAAAEQDDLSSEKQRALPQSSKPSAHPHTGEDAKMQHTKGDVQMSEEVLAPQTDAAPLLSDSQDGSSAYLANAMDAVNILLRSASQQTAALGLSTLLTILKVEQLNSMPFSLL